MWGRLNNNYSSYSLLLIAFSINANGATKQKVIKIIAKFLFFSTITKTSNILEKLKNLFISKIIIAK